MCLIAYRPKSGSHIPNAVIEYNLKSNPDGFGIAWRDPDKGVMYEKYGPKESEAFVKMLKFIDGSDMQYVAHWRKATHGPCSRDLAHPFPYTDKDGNALLLFHNGIIDIQTKEHESDTSVFAEKVLSGLSWGWWNDPVLLFLVEGTIGWSRLLIMTPDDDIIINESSWKKDNGLLYSTTPIYTPIIKKVEDKKEERSYLPAKRYPWYYTPKAEIDIDMYDDDDDDDKLLDDEKSYRRASWQHQGHTVYPTTTIDSGSDDEDESYGTCICDDCGTDGEYYVIDGRLFVDISHMTKQGVN